MAKKRFNVGREQKILKSGVRTVFTPHRPVQSVELFFGRQDEVQKLIATINTPGQHVLLFGDRGVGKSSLANISAHLLQNLMRGKLYIKHCDSSDTFATIVAKPLEAVGHDLRLVRTERKTTRAGRAKLKIPVAEASLGAQKENTLTFAGVASAAISPAWVAEQLSDHNGILVIDETDAITDIADRTRLAEFIKHLSDADSKLKVMIVGISETGGRLTGGHPSIHRCLKETKLTRMNDAELREILDGGARRLRINFDDGIAEGIVSLSAGYHHFTHLLALKCAEEVVADDRVSVRETDLVEALDSSMKDAEGSLRKTYDEAVRSSRHRHVQEGKQPQLPRALILNSLPGT